MTIEIKEQIIQLLHTNKTEDLFVANNNIIVTALSTVHLKFLAQKLKRQLKVFQVSAEGLNNSNCGWVYFYFADFNIHLMLKQQREFYNLEELYSQQINQPQQR